MSWKDLRDDISWSDYYCLLSIALDREELEDFTQVRRIHGSDAVKKWKWQSPDQAGTKRISQKGTSAYQSPVSGLINITKKIMKVTELKPMGGNGAELFAQGTGRPIGYFKKDRITIVNKKGKVIDRTRDMLLVPWTGEE